MKTLDIPDADRERIEALRAELAEQHAGPYATVETDDVLAYLLDLAEAVDDPEYQAEPEGSPASGDEDGTHDPDEPFDRETVRKRLAERNRKHADPDETDRMDLYTIAAEFDVAGRSGMTKDELIGAILDRAAELAVDPFAAVDVDVEGVSEVSIDPEETEPSDETADDGATGDENADDGATGDENADDGADTESTADGDSDGSDDSDSSQLNAMMSLLDTHDDKWREGDGDVRYEVDLPDGGVETARTKDDVRALLFRNY